MDIKHINQAMTLSVLLMLAGNASAVTYDLCTGVTSQTMADGEVVTLWGYGIDSVTSCAISVPGPQLDVPPGDNTLTINLRNALPESVSVVIAGQSLPSGGAGPVTFVDGDGRSRVRSFTHETAPFATGTYTWTALREGTYLYSSGTHPAKQVQMGLYGAMINQNTANSAYGTAYDSELTLIYSEIDPGLHAAVANGTYGSGAYTSTINYVPRYFLVNGDAYGEGSIPAGTSGNNILVRMLNAGLENHAVVLQGEHLSLIAEDGYPYPYSREQYSLLLAAGKTRDGIFSPGANGTYAAYDRRLRIGLTTDLQVGADLLAVNDAVTIDEDSATTVINVLGNDVSSLAAIDPASVTIERPLPPGSGTLTVNTTSGEVNYTPPANFHGSVDFTYSFSDTASTPNSSNAATVTVTLASVNDIPVAVADTYNVTVGSRSNQFAILDNDTDADGDTLSILGRVTYSGGNARVGNDSRSVIYTPNPAFSGTDVISYTVTDGFATDTSSVTVNVGGVTPPDDDDFILHTERAITSPEPGSTLTGADVLFTWRANDTPVDQWWVYAGASARSKSYYDSGQLNASTSTMVSGLPTDGSTVYVTLWYREAGRPWQTLVESYTAASAP